MSNLFERYREDGKKRCRLRDLGIHVGEYAPGPKNSITDVPGVRVGHSTLIEGSGRRKPGNGPVRTGVTVIIPNDDVYQRKLVSGGFILSGAGEVTGLTQIMEWGFLETPLALTNTMSVGRVGDSLIKWMSQKYSQIRDFQEVIIPVVGECDDSFLNDAVGLHIKPQNVFSALDSASEAPVEEGAVGAGTGMVCCDLKGGIGSASRIVPMGDQNYTLGVLVLSNFGVMEHLRVDGYPVGRVLAAAQGAYSRRTSSYGSIICVVGTDMPLTSMQINRLCRRAALGIGRVGSYGAHSSGEIIVGFSTANIVPRQSPQPQVQFTMILDMFLDPAYKAVIEATEEAILNSLTRAVDMEGANNNRVPAINLQLLKGLFEHYNSVKGIISAK
ncbi:MAG: P1 family peptidase [Deltaproteobacteria bacterium]|nr:P1 family peptidase [Deltaproteobacteria bacterium]MBI3293444.1 P1 family peptidase [Deltaproteobacteria bacterium]